MLLLLPAAGRALAVPRCIIHMLHIVQSLRQRGSRKIRQCSGPAAVTVQLLAAVHSAADWTPMRRHNSTEVQLM